MSSADDGSAGIARMTWGHSRARGRGGASRPLAGHVLAAAAHGIETFIGAHGGSAERVLIGAGIRERDLDRREHALDLRAYVNMVELAARDTRNDNFGLWYGQQFLPEHLGLIGEIAICSPTLGVALENLVRLFRYHQQATETRLAGGGGYLGIHYRIIDGAIVERRQDAELTIGMFANIVRRALGAGWCPEEVRFEHAVPEAPREHERAFSAPAYFMQPTNALVIRADQLAAPMPGADPRRLETLKAELVRIKGGAGAVPLVDRLKAEIRGALADGYPHVERVADQTGMHRWTMQRRLGDEGMTFSELVEQVRRELALVYLRQPHLSIGDISAFLGYSEQSAFSRAYRRWTGVSPRAEKARAPVRGYPPFDPDPRPSARSAA